VDDKVFKIEIITATNNSNTIMTSPTSNKTIFITGSTSGIGRATTLELVKNASILILPVRNLTKGEALKKELLAISSDCQIDLLECNLESIKSVQKCANTIAGKYPKIDILINNAGIMEPDFRLTVDGIESHFQVNVLSQYIFNTILKSLVSKSQQGRIINLSSQLHNSGKFELESINTKPTGIMSGIGLYSNSNLYRNLLTFQLAKELQGANVTVNCLHPGVIKTNLGSNGSNMLWNCITPIFHLFTKPPTEGAKTTLHLALSDEGGQITGKYWSDSKVAKQSELSNDTELAEQLVVKCHELTKI
jgi:NAD(P)-dependent dehydrogenase (short-subunit alcohol dehydrogenase family)